MTIVNIHDAKTNFSKLINKALAGEEVVIARGGEPLIRLTPFVAGHDISQGRKGNQFRGIIKIEDNFDAPLPPDIQKGFDGV